MSTPRVQAALRGSRAMRDAEAAFANSSRALNVVRWSARTPLTCFPVLPSPIPRSDLRHVSRRTTASTVGCGAHGVRSSSGLGRPADSRSTRAGIHRASRARDWRSGRSWPCPSGTRRDGTVSGPAPPTSAVSAPRTWCGAWSADIPSCQCQRQCQRHGRRGRGRALGDGPAALLGRDRHKWLV